MSGTQRNAVQTLIYVNAKIRAENAARNKKKSVRKNSPGTVDVMTKPKMPVKPVKPIDSSLPLVAPAYHPAYRPIQTGKRNLAEGRPGAYAYRDVPSLMGGSRVPYISSLGSVIGDAE
jgi:hypothetical protein